MTLTTLSRNQVNDFLFRSLLFFFFFFFFNYLFQFLSLIFFFPPSSFYIIFIILIYYKEQLYERKMTHYSTLNSLKIWARRTKNVNLTKSHSYYKSYIINRSTTCSSKTPHNNYSTRQQHKLSPPLSPQPLSHGGEGAGQTTSPGH